MSSNLKSTAEIQRTGPQYLKVFYEGALRKSYNKDTHDFLDRHTQNRKIPSGSSSPENNSVRDRIKQIEAGGIREDEKFPQIFNPIIMDFLEKYTDGLSQYTTGTTVLVNEYHIKDEYQTGEKSKELDAAIRALNDRLSEKVWQPSVLPQSAPPKSPKKPPPPPPPPKPKPKPAGSRFRRMFGGGS